MRAPDGSRLLCRRRVGLALIAIGAAAFLVGCGGSDGDGSDDSADDDVVVGDSVGIDGVAGIESVDRRSEVLAEVGGPDAFVISVDEVGGEVSRLESWSYYEAQSQIDFIDGEILWDVEIDDVPDGMLLPLGFTPTEFTMLSSVDEVLAGLEDVELEPLVETAAEFEVEGAELWVGEQLALVFIDDALVYVEAFALAVDDQVVVP
jgi:hypothetical protein